MYLECKTVYPPSSHLQVWPFATIIILERLSKVSPRLRRLTLSNWEPFPQFPQRRCDSQSASDQLSFEALVVVFQIEDAVSKKQQK